MPSLSLRPASRKTTLTGMSNLIFAGSGSTSSRLPFSVPPPSRSTIAETYGTCDPREGSVHDRVDVELAAVGEPGRLDLAARSALRAGRALAEKDRSARLALVPFEIRLAVLGDLEKVDRRKRPRTLLRHLQGSSVSRGSLGTDTATRAPMPARSEQPISSCSRARPRYLSERASIRAIRTRIPGDRAPRIQRRSSATTRDRSKPESAALSG